MAALLALLLFAVWLNWHLRREVLVPDRPQTQSQALPLQLPALAKLPVTPSPTETAGTDVEAQFITLLERAEYPAAVAFYLEILRTDDDQAVKLQRLFYQYLGTMQKESPQRAIVMARAWLEHLYGDVITLIHLASALQAVGQYNEAIETIYAIKVLGYDPRFSLGYRGSLRRIVSSTDRDLSARQQHDALLAFYQSLEFWELAEAADRFRMAELYYLLGQIEQAQALLQTLATEPGWQQQAQAMREQLAVPAQAPASIALQTVGEHLLVDATLDYQAGLHLVLDPQAQYSLLSARTFARIRRHTRLSYAGRREIETGRGKLTVQLYTARTVQLGSYLLNNIEFAVVPGMVAASGDGVLGGPALGQLDYALKREAGRLLIHQRLPVADP